TARIAGPIDDGRNGLAPERARTDSDRTRHSRRPPQDDQADHQRAADGAAADPTHVRDDGAPGWTIERGTTRRVVEAPDRGRSGERIVSASVPTPRGVGPRMRPSYRCFYGRPRRRTSSADHPLRGPYARGLPVHRTGRSGG